VATGDGTVPAEDEVSGPKKRSGKTQLFIDFVDAPEVDEDELFAPGDATSLMFTAANEAENRKSKHVLPDDIHFSSKQLLRMFLKPSYIVSLNHTLCKSIVSFIFSGTELTGGSVSGRLDQVQGEKTTRIYTTRNGG